MLPNTVATPLAPQTPLNPNLTALQQMLKAKHAVIVSGKVWYVDGKMAFWPESGKYKFSKSIGGKSGTLRGRAESIFEQIESELRAV